MTTPKQASDEILKEILNESNPVRHCCRQMSCDDKAALEYLQPLIKAYKDNACQEMLDRLQQSVAEENVSKKYGYTSDGKKYGYKLAMNYIKHSIQSERNNLNKSKEEK